MNAEQYAAQNALGFEGDNYLKQHVIHLVQKHMVNVIIETGTYLGATTLQFAKMADPVFTIEANEEYYNKAKERFANTGLMIFQRLGSSAVLLPSVIEEARQYGNMLFFLDAHWGANNPLLQELKIIADVKLKPVIIIHDFKVPEHPELGFDSYGGQDYEWDWISAAVENIYGPEGYTYFYNTEAEGAKRGVIFIEPK